MERSAESASLQNAVAQAMQRIDALDAVRAIHARLQVEIDRRKPICVASGKCCHFESYGHRLYVTTLELAAFMQDLARIGEPAVAAKPPPVFQGADAELKPVSEVPRSAGSEAKRSGSSHDLRNRLGLFTPTVTNELADACPLQVGKLCGVHAIRPFGCRIFFCDPSATDWQQQQYELFHVELKNLHRAFDVDYLYVEWRFALASLRPWARFQTPGLGE